MNTPFAFCLYSFMLRLRTLQRSIGFAFCLLFLLVEAIVCYRRPLPDDFDRYIYEAILLQRSKSLNMVYVQVKHESPRAENSSVLDSPEHLRQLEPLYAIRPLYLELVSWISAFLQIQHAIRLVSALSLLGIGILVLTWTKKPIETILLMAAYPVLNLGRGGTPDALAALLAIAALWLIKVHGQHITGILLLFLSLGVRTDNVLILLAILIWLAWERRIPAYAASIACIIAVGIVIAINHVAGNYGWVVLFRYSFLGGKYPAQMPHTLSFHEYLTGLSAGIEAAFSQMAIWLLIAIWAWVQSRDSILLVAGGVAAVHFLLFPSAEVRYLMWACIIATVSLILSWPRTRPSIAPPG